MDTRRGEQRATRRLTRTRVFVSGLVGLSLAVGASGSVLAQTVESGSITAQHAARFVDLINAHRASVGVAPLRVNAQLSTIAAGWAARMATEQQCSNTAVLRHNDEFVPSGPMPANLAATWSRLSENIGCAQPADVVVLHEGFLNSPHHLANIVDPKVNSIGVGVVVDADGVMWVTEDFGTYAPVGAAASGPGVNGPGVTGPNATAPGDLALTPPSRSKPADRRRKKKSKSVPATRTR